MKKLILTGIAILCMVLCSSCTKALDIQDYFEIEVTGFDGHATAKVTTDATEFIADVFEKDSDLTWSAEIEALALFGDMRVELDKTEGISNGDEITATIKGYKEDKFKDKLNIKFSSSSFKIKVSGLEQATEIDPFEGLVVTYSNISPNARAVFDNSGCDEAVRDNVSFSYDNNNCANGDTIKVTANFNERTMLSKGIVFTSTEKEYVVAGAAYYVSTLDDIDSASAEGFEAEYLDQVVSKLAGMGIIVNKEVSGSKLSEVYVIDQWLVTDIVYVPKKVVILSAKESNAYTHNQYTVLWEVSITAEKTKAEYYKDDTGYNVGDVKTVVSCIETSTTNIYVNAEGNIDMPAANTIKTTVHGLNIDAAGRADEMTAKNRAEYTVTVSDYK